MRISHLQSPKGDNIVQVRRRNRAAVLEHILRKPGISRSVIVQRTGLTASAVSDIVRELLNEGLITEAASPPGKTGRKVGRNPVRLHIKKDASWVLGVLLYRDRIAAALTNLTGQIVFSSELAVDCTKVETAQAAILQLTDEASAFADNAEKEIVSMGISIPGMVMAETGSVRYSAILHWQDIKLVDRLRPDIPYPIVMNNDVRGMALARYWFTPQPHDQFLMVYLGQGIACCSVQGGTIWTGGSGAAGQIGHSILDPGGPQCPCGQRGCFEAMVSSDRFMEMVGEQVHRGAVTSLPLVDIEEKRMNVQRVCELIEQRDEAITGAMRELARFLGMGLSNLIKIYDPQALVLSGGLFRGSPTFVELVKAHMHAYFLSQQASPQIVIDDNTHLPLQGAAAMALDRFVFRPSQEAAKRTATG